MPEPDHSKFTYNPRDIDEAGAVKKCICKECKIKREAFRLAKEQKDND